MDPQNGTTKLLEAIETFALDRQSYCSHNTVIWYKQMLGHLDAHFHNATLIDVSERSLMQFLVDQRGRKREDGREGGVSNVTIAGHVRAIRIFFRWCFERGLLAANPAKHLRGPRSNHGPKSLTSEEVKRMLLCLEDNSWRTDSYAVGAWPTLLRDRALILLMLDTGCRASEARLMKIEDINMKEGFAEVIGKGDKKRLVGLRPKTIAALHEYLGGRSKGRIFCTNDGRPLSRFGLSQILRRLSKRVGFKVHPHMLRHTFGTLAITKGMDPSHLQYLMGHAQISTTQVYIKAARETAALKAHAQFSPVNDG